MLTLRMFVKIPPANVEQPVAIHNDQIGFHQSKGNCWQSSAKVTIVAPD